LLLGCRWLRPATNVTGKPGVRVWSSAEERSRMAHEIDIQTVARRHVAAVKFRCPVAEIPSRMADAFGAVMFFLQKGGIEPQAPAVAIYDAFAGDAVSVAAGFYVSAPIEGDGHVVPATTPAGEAAVTAHWGSYETLEHAYADLQAWM
jgi:effector-binding domain-containing protein